MFDETIDARFLTNTLQAFRPQNRHDIRIGPLEIVIDNHIIIGCPALDFIAGIIKAFGNHLRGVLIAPFQPVLKLGHGRGQNENSHHILSGFGAHLLCALIINIEQHIPAFCENSLNRRARCAVKIAMHLGGFEQVAILAQPLKFLQADKMIMNAIHLAGAARACGYRHRQSQIRRAVLQQHACQRGFARPRRRGQDEHQPPAGKVGHFGAVHQISLDILDLFTKLLNLCLEIKPQRRQGHIIGFCT